MAITTLDGIIAGFEPSRTYEKVLSGTLVAGRPHSYWAVAGIPGPGSYDTTLNGVTLSSTSAQVNGQIPFSDPVSGNAYLARLVGGASQYGTIVLADRLWHNGGFTITSTSAQNITSPTWPSRSSDGTANGDGVFLGMEISAATGAGTPTITATYTNQAGTGSKTGTNIVATVASSIAGTFYPIGLAAGDTGVRSVQSITLSATWTSGTMNLVAYRELARLDVPLAGGSGALDFTKTGLLRLYNGTVPFIFFIPNTTTTSRVYGSVTYTDG